MFFIKEQSVIRAAGLAASLMLIPTVDAMASGITPHTPDNVRTLSLDSAYKQSPYSDRAVTDFNMEMIQGTGYLYGKFYDWQDKDNWWSRIAWEAANLGLNYMLSTPFTTADHEIGHGTRMMAAGVTPSFAFAKTSADYSAADPTTYNMFDFYFRSFAYRFKNYDHAYTNSNPAWTTTPEYLSQSTLDQAKISFLIQAGGVNKQMYSTEAMSKMIYQHGGHVSYIVPYTIQKLNSYFYKKTGRAGDDLDNLVNYYTNIRGYKITRKGIRTGDLKSFLLSSTTYELYFSYLGYLEHGDQSVIGYSYKGFRLPDVFFYATTRGLSYKVDSAYQISDSLSIPFAVERVYNGDSVNEYSIGVNKRFAGWSLSGTAFVGSGASSYLASATIDLSKESDVSLGAEHYNKNTLFGERHTFNYYKQSSNQLWTKLTWKY